jgi:hypothetical protein
MEINIKVNKNEDEILSCFNDNISMNIEQLNNFATYINKLKTYKVTSNDMNNIIIKNKNNILHATNYKLDDTE